MKLKYYMRGLGTGIFVTALILSIAFEFQRADDYKRQEQLLKNETATTKANEQPESDTALENATLENRTEEFLTEAERVTEEETMEEITTEEDTTEEESSTEEEKIEVTTIASEALEVTLDIYSGMSSNKVCARLVELGVIENADDFNNYLYAHHLENRIAVGSFRVRQGQPYEELASIIIRR